MTQENIKEQIIENIAARFDHLDGLTNRKAIMAHFLKTDESHLWPICNAFNVTSQAIKILRNREKQRGEYSYGLELALELDQIIGELVNQEV